MTAQWICPLICEYPIHCLRPPQIAGGHLTSALKAKQPCSWKNTFIPRSVVRRAALDCCDNAPRLTEESQRASALSCAHWARLPTPHDALVFKKKKKHLAMTVLSQQVIAHTQFAVRRLRQQAAPWWIRPLFRWPASWSQTSYQPSYMWHARVSPPTSADPRSEGHEGSPRS